MSGAGLKNHGLFVEPGKLWSLWDMLRIYAKPFVEASELLGHMIALLDLIKERNPTDQSFQLNKNASEDMVHQIEPLIEQLDILNLDVTKKSAQRLLDYMKNPNASVSLSILKELVGEVRGRLTDQLDGTYLLSLSASERKMYEPPTPRWGTAVSAQFLRLRDEIDEAGKCFALGRFTGCAFHSLRCLEAGIYAMSRCLGIPDPTHGPERSWAIMLKAIKNACDAKWNSMARMDGDGQLFEEMYMALASMQNPWRNATMHLEHSFTEEQAADVFNTVRAFMQRLAGRMNEDGNPKVYEVV